MGTGELHKGQPVLALLAPAGANGAPLGQPAQRPFHDPAPRWVFLRFRNRLRQWLAALASMGNVFVIVRFFDQMVHVLTIIALVQAQMLLTGRPPDHNRNEKVLDRPLVMLVSAGDLRGQRRTTPINPEMNLRAALAPVRWIGTGLFAAQRRRDGFAVDGLPFPVYAPATGVETNQGAQDTVPDTLPLPRLEAFVQYTAGNPESITVYRFPLTASPQHIPDAIDDGAVVRSRSSWSAPLGALGNCFLMSRHSGRGTRN